MDFNAAHMEFVDDFRKSVMPALIISFDLCFTCLDHSTLNRYKLDHSTLNSLNLCFTCSSYKLDHSTLSNGQYNKHCSIAKHIG